MTTLDPNKFYVIGDREGFMIQCAANKNLIKIFDDIGPFKPKLSPSEGIYAYFEDMSGNTFTAAEIAHKYGADHSCHLTKGEAAFLREYGNTSSDTSDLEQFNRIHKIPEIRLTITTMEEVHAAIIMLQGLKDASV
ncbi:hypothetical protein [Enterobacter phage ZX14]